MPIIPLPHIAFLSLIRIPGLIQRIKGLTLSTACAENVVMKMFLGLLGAELCENQWASMGDFPVKYRNDAKWKGKKIVTAIHTSKND